MLSLKSSRSSAGLHYSLGSYRESVNVQVTTATNERWEVEFFADGSVEIERFVNAGKIETDPRHLEDLFRD